MPLFATLAYAIAAIVRPRPPDVEISDLKAQIAQLEEQIGRLRDELTVMQINHAPARQTAQQNQYPQTVQQMRMNQYSQAVQQMRMYSQTAIDDYVRNCTPGRHELFALGMLDNRRLEN